MLLHGLLLLGCPRSLYLGVLDGLLRCGLGLGLGRRLGLGLRCGLLLGCLGSLLGRGLLLGLGLGGLPGGYLGLLRRLHLRLLRWQILTVSHNNLLRCALYNKSSVLHYTRKCVSEGFLARLVYIIEDDLTLGIELGRLLTLAGFEAACCQRFDRAAEDALAASPACVVLDLNLPGADGLQVCRDLRAASDVPIIVLTTSESEFDEVMAMNLGADDYVTKPYRPAVLIARVQAHVRRRGAQPGAAVVEHGGIRLDLGTGTVSYGERTAQLTRNEQRILQMLLEGAGAVVSRQELMCDLWESDAFVDDNTLTVNVNRLRKALASLGVPEGFLQTRRGVGYLVP